MSKLRILHLFSNWKWTGPAEPAVLLAAEQKRAGHHVSFACGRPVKGCENEVAREARARGLEPIESLRLAKHRNVVANLHDRRRLGPILREGRFDVLHVHQPNDHLVGAAVTRRVSPDTRIVRVFYDGEPPPATRLTRRLFGRLLDGVVVFGPTVAEDFSRRFGVPASRILRTDPPTDLARYDPARALPSLREELGFGADDVVVGIVARIQKHRRYELLFAALERTVARIPSLRLLVVGRGTHQEELAHGPAGRPGLRGHVTLGGYRRGDEYVRVLAAMDAKVFLVPGTDGTCRAAREALAMGVPVISTRRGLLPEIVEDGVTGLLVDESAESLAAALEAMARPDGPRGRLAEAARDRARDRFDPVRYAARVSAFAR